MTVDPQQGPPVGRIVVIAFVLVLFGGLILGALAFGGFFNAPASTRPAADLARLAPEALAASPGVRYQLSVEVGEAGNLQGLASSGLIDFQAQRFQGDADRGRGNSMLLFGGPDRGSAVLADGLFVRSDAGPWEAVPVENAARLRPLLDPSVVGSIIGGAIDAAQIDPTVRTESCPSGSCQVVSLVLPPHVVSDAQAQLFGQAQPPPPDLLPIQAELWLVPETGFPTRIALETVAGGTSSKVALDLERLDPPPRIDAPLP